MTHHNQANIVLLNFVNEQAEHLVTNCLTETPEILDAIERILATDGINDPAQVSYFLNEGQSYLSQDPNGQKLSTALTSAIKTKDQAETATLLAELYDWLNASFEEVEGV